jgi:hypothetical protein
MKIKIENKIPDTIMTGEKERGRPIHVLQVPFRFSVVTDVLPVVETLYVIPAGTRTDFASIPRPIWSVFLPSDPEYCAEALIHDVFYAGNIFPRKLCDKIFLQAMRDVGVSRWKRSIMYSAVRVFGGFYYRNCGYKRMMDIRQKMFSISETRRPLWQSL